MSCIVNCSPRKRSTPDMYVEPPPCGRECLAYRDVNVLVLPVFRGLSVHDDLAPGNYEVDVHFEEVAFEMPAMRLGNRDAVHQTPVLWPGIVEARQVLHSAVIPHQHVSYPPFVHVAICRPGYFIRQSID